MVTDRDEWLLPGWEVRLGRADDAAQLTDVEARARAPLHDARGGAAWLRENPEVGDWSHRLVEGGVLVASIDGVVVGFLEVDIRGADGRACVCQVYVEPEARGVGFGDMLLDAARDLARTRGCTIIEGEALPGDRDTKNLYERAGITARKIVVSAPL